MTITDLRALLAEHPDADGWVYVLTIDGYLDARAGINEDGDLVVVATDELMIAPAGFS